MANQELKFLAQGLSRLNPTERLLKIVFNLFQRVLAQTAKNLSSWLSELLEQSLTRTHVIPKHKVA